MQQNILNTFITLLLVALAFIFGQAPASTPCGIFLPAERHGAHLVPGQDIPLYNDMPVKSETLGMLSIQMLMKDNSTAEQERIINYAKSIAQQSGGNGLVIQQFGHPIAGSVPDAMMSYDFRATVIVA